MWNAASVDHPPNGYSVFRHAVQNHARVERCALNGGKQLIFRGALQVPSQGHAAQIRIYQHGAITVVPCQTQQSRLSGAIIRQAAAKVLDAGVSASCDGLEYVANGRKPRFDSSALRMHAALDHSANARYKVYRRSDADDAGRSADYVHHVVGAAACADGIPVRIKGTHRDRDACRQSKLLGPIGRELSG